MFISKPHTRTMKPGRGERLAAGILREVRGGAGFVGAYFSPTNNLTSDRTAGSVIGKTCPRCLNCLQRQLLFPLNTSLQSCSIEDFLEKPSASRIAGSFS